MSSSTIPYYDSYDYFQPAYTGVKPILKNDVIFDSFFLDSDVPLFKTSFYGVGFCYLHGFLNSLPALSCLGISRFPSAGNPFLKDSKHGLMLCSFFTNYIRGYFTSFMGVSYEESYNYLLSALGKYVIFNLNAEYPLFRNSALVVFDTFEDAFAFIGNDGETVIKIISEVYKIDGYYYCKGDEWTVYGVLPPVVCCYPDFAPIVKIFGGTPSSNQLSNIKTIASLLGCDTSENGLSGCKLGFLYVERVVAMLGGSVYSDLPLTLKEACRVLGVDTNENGLKDCELSKEYVKRISTMLGA
ncbi:hypothetical protein SJPD1_1051 [Sulfurospirillum diekertiae]|uniref:Uncharacterized protein n=1 Tax=Sulfurospirillum diekertiae TaxID=1854492 RepID=A0A290HC86_9BACT|nr:hypothetical protein [Sulfurospirillum diekertiae]ATB69163.1 hypothetical protein SJPD1_1051 [Sulfurospirillum diekertiae]